MRRRLIASLFFFAAATSGANLIRFAPQQADAREVVEILLRGRYFVEPATVQITVAVEPDKANRALRIEADGDQLFRASELTLAGANEKRLHAVEFKNLPAGTYTLRASVMSSDDVRGMASQELVVSGAGMR